MGCDLFFAEKGYGSPLILLHGNGEDHNIFCNQMDFFARKYRVIAPDTRGHGLSPKGDKPFSLYTFADDLKELLDSQNIKKADILGFSDGGNIALIFALKYPEYVNRLILNSANLYPSGLKFGFIFPIRCMYSFMSLFKKGGNKRRGLFYLMVKEPRIAPSELNALSMPVLVIAGKNDIIKEKHTRLIAASIPGSTMCFLNGGHSIVKSDSIEFNKEVEKFLEN